MNIFARIAAALDGLLDDMVQAGELPAGLNCAAVTVEPPRDPSHGDMATNAAMVLAKPAGTNPRALAELIAGRLRTLADVDGVEIAGPGFINLRLVRTAWEDELAAIHAAGSDYGRSTMGKGVRVNIEYVSANPTGPMHMGHCRGAVVGDALAALLEYAGHSVIREYYINDAGAQVQTLGRSVHLRYREALGETIAIPEGFYPGEYLIPIGQALAAEFGDRYVGAPEADWLDLFRERAVAAMMDMIRADLALLGIHHDVFASEAAVQQAGRVDAALARLEAEGLIYQGVLEPPKGELPDDWEPTEMTLFRATQFGDDSDRPVRKSDGGLTYFGTDLAYHAQKAENADQLIDIWGADHAGTVKRIKAAVAALTGGKVQFDVKLVQMVRLMRNGELVRMGKRLGNFVTLADVVEEVGKDVVRFTMLTRKADAQMDFDFAKVVEASKDNPVFYVQYGHARISSLARRVQESFPDGLPAADSALFGPEELDLVKQLATFPRVVEAAANAREPHRIAFYLYDLAASFHGWWNLGNDQPERRVIVAGDAGLTAARLHLSAGIGQVIKNGLALMGVSALEEMN
ncbi:MULTISPECIES: arginine--tRNA ligase [unclassified Sphingobium]|uniref:arginine--tRNA ligase n=1 Tax=unclassified Sphingobium TaxID=2611147 RepID=UPI0022259EFB|nr:MULTISPECIES: arginine--tRNA ligase [unclassified Sphingobium]MCW2413039.1 arginyl-tRNA synthetase [Sphingobium sp. B8D3D]MCW2414662.1 arginyl-tRNA synthetase [Sphingobium sp. B8D3A]